jgi:hypothetical protein
MFRFRTATKSAAGECHVSPPGYRSLEPSLARLRPAAQRYPVAQVQTTAPDALMLPCRLACRGHFGWRPTGATKG